MAGLSDKYIVPALSIPKVIGWGFLRQRMSARRRDNHTASLVAMQHAIYSASHVEVAVLDCFLDFQLTAAPAIKKTYPLVDLRVSMHPA